MEPFIKRMVSEHSELHVKRVTLEDKIYNGDTSNINKADFANMCMQLAAMRQYEKCLEARLSNMDVIFENGVYLEKIAVI